MNSDFGEILTILVNKGAWRCHWIGPLSARLDGNSQSPRSAPRRLWIWYRTAVPVYCSFAFAPCRLLDFSSLSPHRSHSSMSCVRWAIKVNDQDEWSMVFQNVAFSAIFARADSFGVAGRFRSALGRATRHSPERRAVCGSHCANGCPRAESGDA